MAKKCKLYYFKGDGSKSFPFLLCFVIGDKKLEKVK